MSNSFQSQQPFHQDNRKRLFLVSAGILLLLSGAVLLLLNALGIVSLSTVWFNTLEAFLAVLGVLAAFGQWVSPSSRHLGNRQQETASSSALNRQRKAFCRQVKRGLNRFLGKGRLIVFAEDHEAACEVSLINRRLWVQCPLDAKDRLIPIRREVVRSYRVRAGHIYAVVFCDLDPDDYVAWFDISQPIFVPPVFSNQVTVVHQR